MGQYWASMRQLGAKSSPAVAERTVAFLRSRYRTKTADCVSADTGISAKTVAKWLERSSAPGGIAILQLIAAYGPEFLRAIMTSPPAWLDDAARAEEARKLKAEIDALNAKLEAL